MKSLEELQRRRSEIIEKIEAQRLELAEIAQHLKAPLSMVDKGMTAVRFIRQHPALTGGGVLALWGLRRHGVLGLVRKVWKTVYVNPSFLSFGTKLISRFSRNSRQHDVPKVLH